jgi:hypothetical protein
MAAGPVARGRAFVPRRHGRLGAPIQWALPMEHPNLSEALPAQIAGSGHGWLTAYRRFPVFSPRWARERARRLGLLVMVLSLLVLGGTLLSVPDDRPWGAMLQIGLTIAFPLFTAPWLACGGAACPSARKAGACWPACWPPSPWWRPSTTGAPSR